MLCMQKVVWELSAVGKIYGALTAAAGGTVYTPMSPAEAAVAAEDDKVSFLAS